MFVKAGQSNHALIYDYIKAESDFNLFFLADIEMFGYDNPIQSVYMAIEKEALKAVFLQYQTNLIVYSKTLDYDITYVSDIMQKHPIKNLSMTLANYGYLKDLFIHDNVVESTLSVLKDLIALEYQVSVNKAKVEDSSKLIEAILKIEEFAPFSVIKNIAI